MTDSTRYSELFDTLAKVLLRCWLYGFLLLLIWFGAYMAAGDAIYRVHGPMFGLSKHEMDVIFYCGMGLWKLSVLVFFFIPWLAIRPRMRDRAS